MNFLTIGSSPKGTDDAGLRCNIDDSILRAVLTELYDSPCSCNVARKSRACDNLGEITSLFLTELDPLI